MEDKLIVTRDDSYSNLKNEVLYFSINQDNK